MGKTIESLRTRLSDFATEWRARRRGRQYVSRDLSRSTREITGVTGWMTSRAWDEVERSGDAYIKSFDQGRLPPSLHISSRDAVRAGQAMPMSERCIEDYNKPERRWPPHDPNSPAETYPSD